MSNHRPFDGMPSGYEDDQPFHMSDMPHSGMIDKQELAPSPRTLVPDTLDLSFRKNRFFGGVCLALPLSALFWVALYYLLR